MNGKKLIIGIIGICTFSNIIPVIAESNIPSECDMETGEGCIGQLYSNGGDTGIYDDQDGQSGDYSTENIGGNVDSGTTAETEIDDSGNTENQNDESEISDDQTTNEKITDEITDINNEIIEQLNTINQTLKGGPLKSPALSTAYIGLDINLPVYIYSVFSPSQNKTYYIGSNSNALEFGTASPDNTNAYFLKFNNIYVNDEGKQQAIILYDDINKAESPLWGTATISSSSANALIHTGAVYGNKRPFITPYSYLYPVRVDTTDSGEADGTQWAQLYIGYKNTPDGSPSPGNTTQSLDLSTYKLETTIYPPEPHEFKIEDIYFLGGIIISLLLLLIFKRGRRT